MARQYEAVYIFDSSLEETAISEKLTRFHNLVAPNAAADAIKVNHWGKRTLAYPIKKRETGYYVVANFEAEGKALPEFERAIKLDDGVLRHLVVVNEHDYTPTRDVSDRKQEEDDE
jgi:small subunit ribosomal protein S6